MRLDCWSSWSAGRVRRRRGGGFGCSGSAWSVAFEAAGLHSVDGFGVLHEGIPDKGGAEIFGHEETDAEIDAEDLGVVPVEVGVEGVAETIAAPGISAEVVSHGAEDADTFTGKKGKRSGGGAGNDGPVDRTHEGRSSPGGVAVGPVGGADSPVVVGVAAVEAKAERFVGAGRGDGVDEVVSEGVALAGEIKPGVGELMDEEGIFSADERVRPEGHRRASEGAPGFGRDGI